MNKKLRKWLRLLLAGVFLVSTVLLVRQMLHSAQAEETYARAQQIAFSSGAVPRQETEPPAEQAQPEWIPAPVEKDASMLELEKLNLQALQQENPDVIGWIRIPGSKVDYPLMQGKDNQFYLDHTWEGEKSSVGSIFLECANASDFSDFNTIVYGHNRSDGSMFACLYNFSSQWYCQTHPYIYLASGQGVLRYEVFSAYRTVTGTFAYGISLPEQEKQEFLQKALERSRVDMGVEPQIQDRILTLSTCTSGGYDSRWVVHARLKMIQAS